MVQNTPNVVVRVVKLTERRSDGALRRSNEELEPLRRLTTHTVDESELGAVDVSRGLPPKFIVSAAAQCDVHRRVAGIRSDSD